MEVRRLKPQDIGAVLRLAGGAGWNQTARDVERLLEVGGGGCFAAWVGGEVVGTTTTTVYGAELAWVGMVLVSPAFRRRGVATALMEEALSHLRGRGVATVKLDATPAGRPVYERLGFLAEGTLERWEGEAPAGRAGGGVARGEWGEVAELDRGAFGADRGELVCRLVTDAPGRLLVARGAGGEVAGYALSRPGARAEYVGPVVAADLATARELVLAASAGLGGRRVFIDIDPRFPGAAGLAGGLGLVRQRELLRMRLGPATAPRGAAQVFAIAGPEVG